MEQKSSAEKKEKKTTMAAKSAREIQTENLASGASRLVAFFNGRVLDADILGWGNFTEFQFKKQKSKSTCGSLVLDHR